MSCMPEESGVQDTADNFTASIETIFSDELFDWNIGDEISIDGVIYKTAEGGKDAVFAPVAESVPEAEEYFAVFPADKKRYGKGIKAVCPRVMYSDNEADIPDECVVALAKSSSHSFLFKNVLSFISVDLHAEGVKKITISSNAGEAIAGSMLYDALDERTVSVSGSSKLILNMPDDELYFPEGTYWFPLPAITLSQGLKVKLSRGDDWVAEKSYGEELVLERNRIVNLGKTSEWELVYENTVRVIEAVFADVVT